MESHESSIELLSYSAASNKNSSTSAGKHGSNISTSELDGSAFAPASRRESLFLVWAWECLLVLSAFGFMIAIVVILAKNQDQPQPSWSLGININTVIAILATLLRNNIVMVVEEVISQAKWNWQRRPRPVNHFVYFDSASRGVWGSFVLGFKMPKLYGLRSLLSRLSTSAIIACAVTVLSLAIGSFTQQAIQGKECFQPLTTSNASLPLADRLAEIPITRYGANLFDVGPAVKSGIINAIGSNLEEETLLRGCTTGNCTFPEKFIHTGITHRTSGFCSKCIDTTPFLRLARLNITGRPEDGYAVLQRGRVGQMAVGPILNSTQAMRQLNMTLSSLEAGPNGFSWASSAIDDEMRAIIDNNATALTADILSMTTVGCDELPAEYGTTFNCPQKYGGSWNESTATKWAVVAATCVLYPCVMDMEATVSEGSFKETVKRKTPMAKMTNLFEYSATNHISPDLPCKVGEKYYDLSNITQANVTNTTDPGNSHTAVRLNGQVLSLPRECAFSVPYRLNTGLWQFWKTMAPATCAPITNQPDNRDVRRWTQCYGPDDKKEFATPTWWHTGLYNSGNATFTSISQRMDNIAIAITNAMRREGISGNVEDNKNNTVYGTVLRSTVCTSFKWPWLLFPAILVVLTALALALIVWVTAADKDKAPVWKSSVLPMLYGGGLGTLTEMKKTAGKETAMLERISEGGKWQIVLKEAAATRCQDQSKSGSYQALPHAQDDVTRF